MKKYKLEFLGYTWDKFFHMIADKHGLLAIYSGGLDSEGMVKMDALLSISYEEHFERLYEGSKINDLRDKISSSQMLFYSYASVDEEVGKDVSDCINSYLHYGKTNDKIEIHCTGSCALFPEIFI